MMRDMPRHPFGLTPEEHSALRGLNTPWKIQDFLETVPINFEPDGDTCLSPRRVLREKRAHCIEAAMVAALALRLHGQSPLIVDLTATKDDFDHVIAVYRWKEYWGAISKSNHAVLRYRDPVYRTIRELVLSYFHEYTNDAGRKTLRSYTRPVNLSKFDHLHWMTSEEDVWEIPIALADANHFLVMPSSHGRILRQADKIEQKINQFTQWPQGRVSKIR